MKNKPLLKQQIFLFAIITTLFCGCYTEQWSTSRENSLPVEISIDVIKPPYIQIPTSIKKVLVIDFSLYKNKRFAQRDEAQQLNRNYFLDSLASEYFVSQLISFIDTTTRYEIVRPQKNHYENADSLRWKDIADLCNQYKVDAVIALDQLALNLRVHTTAQNNLWYPVSYTSYNEMAIMDVEIIANWKFFNPAARRAIDKYTFNYKRSFTQQARSGDAAIDFLPSAKKIVKTAGQISAKRYARRIAPYWMRLQREYYAIGNADMQLAKSLIDKNKWDEASAIWLNNSLNADKDVARRCNYNLILAYEVQGDIEKAFKQARATYNTYNNDEAKVYMRRLQQRLKDKQLLEKQFGN